MTAALSLLSVLIALAVSLRWVWRDARQRGHDPRLAISAALLCWPLGLCLWLLVRSGRALAPPGCSSAWG